MFKDVNNVRGETSSLSGSGKGYMPTEHFRISEIENSEEIKLESILGDYAIAWLEKKNQRFVTLRICSIFEYYDNTTSKCVPCETVLNWPGY